MKKTGFEWSLEQKIVIKNLNSWEVGDGFDFFDESYYREKIDAVTFEKRLYSCKFTNGVSPIKSLDFLEYRMYGLVPYNLSPIQQGIQFGHAVVEYGTARNLRNSDYPIAGKTGTAGQAATAGTVNTKDLGQPEIIYNQWADNDKTFIILNGGTTNNNPDKLGSLNQHYNLITEKTRTAFFCEPDLGDQLTAFVFLVDERVWNRELYPDFIPVDYGHISSEKIEFERYTKWVASIGGEENVFLRHYLKNLRLA